MQMQTRVKTYGDAFIDFLIDEVLFPKEVESDEPGKTSSDKPTDQTLPLQN